MIHEVRADFSTFYLGGVRLEYDRATAGTGAGPRLIDGDENSMWFIAFRQIGSLPVDIEVLDAEPMPLGAGWQDVTEFSITASPRTTLAGWGLEGPEFEVPLVPGGHYRGRYAVGDADQARSTFDPPYPERYQLRFWPAPLAPAHVVVADSGAGQYWHFQRQAKAAFERVKDLPAGTRTRAIVEIALQEHPEIADKLRRGQLEYRSGIAAYAQKDHPREMDYHEIDALIDSIAAEHDAG